MYAVNHNYIEDCDFLIGLNGYLSKAVHSFDGNMCFLNKLRTELAINTLCLMGRAEIGNY